MELKWSDINGKKEFFTLERGDLFLSKQCQFRCDKDFYHNGIVIKKGELVTVIMRS